jgi:excinuclease ABC subunit A
VISIRGAREHNLKNVDVEIPRDELVVFTGLSGSGKSSLAFDTIYAEGQRRYVESLSAYARQFLEMMQKPDVDQIDGLSPAISIEQKTTSKNPRSTVGTVTEIYDYMRLLWARIGVPYSPATGLPIESQTVSQMVDRILALPEGTRLYLLAPVVRGRKGEYRKELADFLKRGYQRVKVDGQFYEIAEVPALDKKFNHDIDVVVDRIVVRPDLAARLADSLEQALKLADGLAVAEFADALSPSSPGRAEGARPGDPSSSKKMDRRVKPGDDDGESGKRVAKIHDQQSGPQRLVFSEKFACPVSGFTIPEIEPAAVLVQQPVRRLPEMRRPWRRAAYRRRPRHPRSRRHHAQGRDRAVVEVVVALLHPDADGAGQALQVHPRHQVEGAAEGDAEGDPLRLRRRRGDPLHL